MALDKRITYVRVDGGWQTYLHPIDRGFVRYKFLQTSTQLEVAIARCKQAGWKIIDATNLIRKLNSVTPKRY
ncbi:hypothetical protein IQ272_15710 [Chroococcidiopsidales cyanobacterium LEGE 13417]|nr:hypothetical protein [Chroococcidiopsidales cyanobacterium LEGE 13417]